jgi:hypothetical protein
MSKYHQKIVAPQYPQKIVAPRSIYDCQCARVLAMFTSLVTSASHSACVVAPSYQSMFTTFHHILQLLNKMGEIIGPAMKMLKLVSLSDESLIDDVLAN